MLTVIWLIVWLVHGTPQLVFSHQWNNWAVALVICAAIDVVGGGGGSYGWHSHKHGTSE